MDWLDYAFIGIVLISVLLGLLRGFVREIFSLVTWILAFVLTLRYAPLLAERLRPYIDNEALRQGGAYALSFIGVLLAGAIVGLIVSIVVRGSVLSGVDRMLGAGFGLLRGGFVLAAAVLVGMTTALHEQAFWKHSRLVPQIMPAAEALKTLIPDHWLAYLRPRDLALPKPSPAEH